MLSTFNRRFGAPGIIAVFALVFAMLGGAFAASNADDGGATASAKGKRGPTGPKGPKGAKGETGPAGPQGPAGGAGPAGPKGDTGAKGDQGNQGIQGNPGTPGTNGTSVTTTPESPGANCTNGGAKFAVGAGTPTYACNGTNGLTGFTETLPAGKTETGGWATELDGEGYGATFASFAIPLPSTIAAANVHVIEPSETVPTECAGGTATEPNASPAHICIWVTAKGFSTNGSISQVKPAGNPGIEGAGKTGAALFVEGGEAASWWQGTWAVTAPTSP